MTDYAEPESVDLILFNLGYLPGGDHSVCTRAETTLPALEAALTLLKPGGAVGVIIYSGGDTGNEEKDAVLDWLKSLDSRRYLVLVTEYYNRPNHPPLPVVRRRFHYSKLCRHHLSNTKNTQLLPKQLQLKGLS